MGADAYFNKMWIILNVDNRTQRVAIQDNRARGRYGGPVAVYTNLSWFGKTDLITRGDTYSLGADIRKNGGNQMSKRKRHDLPPGCISSSAAARIAGTNLPRVLHWVRTGLLRPECYAGKRGDRNAAFAWRLTDVIAARTVAQLRGQGLSLQRVRRAEAAIKAAGADLAGVYLWSDGRDAFRVIAGKQLVSVIMQPGQHMVFPLSVWAAEVGREVAAEVERTTRSKAG